MEAYVIQYCIYRFNKYGIPNDQIVQFRLFENFAIRMQNSHARVAQTRPGNRLLRAADHVTPDWTLFVSFQFEHCGKVR